MLFFFHQVPHILGDEVEIQRTPCLRLKMTHGENRTGGGPAGCVLCLWWWVAADLPHTPWAAFPSTSVDKGPGRAETLDWDRERTERGLPDNFSEAAGLVAHMQSCSMQR